MTREAFDGNLVRSRPQTATQFVAEALRRAILSGELAAGRRLGLADLAATFEVSTTPVREALRELSFEGLVQFDTYRGGTVNVVSEADMREIVGIRQVLEPLAVRDAIESMTEEVLEKAQTVLARMSPESDWEVWVQGNRDFHQTLYSAGRSRRLTTIIKSLQDPTVMFVSGALERHPELRRRADREHRRLLEAMRDGDAATAVELTLAHLTIPLTEGERSSRAGITRAPENDETGSSR